jgi:hypothetical protein
VSWPNYADSTGKFRFDGDRLVFGFGKWRGYAVKEVPADYIKWFMGADFPADAKALLLKYRHP